MDKLLGTITTVGAQELIIKRMEVYDVIHIRVIDLVLGHQQGFVLNQADKDRLMEILSNEH